MAQKHLGTKEMTGKTSISTLKTGHTLFIYLVWDRVLSSVFSLYGYWRLNSGCQARQPFYQMGTQGPKQQDSIAHHLSSQAWPVREFTTRDVINGCQCLFNDQF